MYWVHDSGTDLFGLSVWLEDCLPGRLHFCLSVLVFEAQGCFSGREAVRLSFNGRRGLVPCSRFPVTLQDTFRLKTCSGLFRARYNLKIHIRLIYLTANLCDYFSQSVRQTDKKFDKEFIYLFVWLLVGPKIYLSVRLLHYLIDCLLDSLTADLGFKWCSYFEVGGVGKV